MTKHTRTFLFGARLMVASAAGTIAIASAALLFGLPRLLPRFGLDGLVTTYRQVIGLSCLVSTTTLLVTQVLPWTARVTIRHLKARLDLRKGRKRLQVLTRSEKNILNQYVSRQTRVLVLDSRSGATAALQKAGVISRTSESEDPWTGQNFTIAPWAWNYVRTNSGVLRQTGNSLTEMSDWRASRRA
jgi:Super-infection exclusion protein B